ncbi:MAG: hypothetical protein M1828_004814 [Chrysothrix sp. TS-e1954]|nr:MAG: hypothetical protein M1828_004814 [Chrysothrix sp. TS-e1954]
MSSILGSSSTSASASVYGGRGPLVLAVTWIEFSLATVLLGLRIYTRVRLVKYAGWALIWACVAWLFAIAPQAMITVAVSKGFGNHITAVLDAGDVAEVGKWSYLSGALVLPSIGLSKVSVVAFLLAILGPTKNKTRYFFIFIAISNMAFDIAQPFWNIFRCEPVSKDWNTSKIGSCYSEVGGYAIFSDFIAAYSALSDFVLALYPIIILWELQMAMRVKAGLGALMALGVLAGVCGVMRAVTVQDGYNALGPNVTDPTYDGATIVFWVWTEMWIVIIASSVPPLWPLIKQTWRTVHSSLSSSRSSGSQTPFRLGRRAKLRSNTDNPHSNYSSETSDSRFKQQDDKLRWGGSEDQGLQRTMPTVNRDSLGLTLNWPLRNSAIFVDKRGSGRTVEGGSGWYKESKEPA